jgi:serine/threonine-protein kinase
MGGDDVIAGTVLSDSIRTAGGSSIVDRELHVGQVLGSYQLERLLGEGSMGQVFQARHVRLGRQVALKVLRPLFAHDRSFVQRFFQEARSVNQINHDTSWRSSTSWEDAEHGHVYCVDGAAARQCLSALLKEEHALGDAHPPHRGVQVCAALGAAHQLGWCTGT